MTIESNTGSRRAEPFADAAQQHRAVMLGMWIFLATEILFFGGPLLLYSADRLAYGMKFIAGSNHLDLVLGTTNTVLLLCSSLAMTLAVEAGRSGEARRASWLLAFTALLGTVFLGIKGFEWHHVFAEHLWPGGGFEWPGADPGPARLFFALYFALTGIHALHLGIGIAFLLLFAGAARWNHPFILGRNALTLLGLYWHFIDIIWVFLFTLLYLGHRHA
jgi:cytochrome c oxidase subunit 3